MNIKNLVELINDFRNKPLQDTATKMVCIELVKFLLKHEEDSFNRNNLEGHITAGGLVVYENYVLLNHHKKLNNWIGFGGHAEAGETDPFEIALREVLEESGLENLKSNGKIFDIDSFTFKHDDNNSHTHYDIRYLFVANNKNFIQSGESNSLTWYPLETAVHMVSDTATRRMLVKYKLLYDNKRKNTPIEELVK